MIVTNVKVKWHGRPALSALSFTVTEKDPLDGLPYYLSCWLEVPKPCLLLLFVRNQKLVERLHLSAFRHRWNSVHVYDSTESVGLCVGPGVLEGVKLKLITTLRDQAPAWWLPQGSGGLMATKGSTSRTKRTF